MGEIEMNDIINFHGYLISQEPDSFTIYSPYVVDELRVFGHDSDYTTIAISLIKHLLNNGVEVLIGLVDDRINFAVLKMATGIELVENGSHLQCREDASVVMSSTNNLTTGLAKVPSKPLDKELYQSVKEAWKTELDIRNISQGAYVSMQQYNESLSARLSLIAQNDGTIIWPPRQMNSDGVTLSKGSINLSPNASVMTWTNLSAAGAPSEFAIRAPILGGLTTVMVEFSEGPKGVFLMVDDKERKPIIGDSVEFVVRMLYGQEGIIRYGAKARIDSSHL
ncbi:MAG: hypothetical protein CMA66_01420 [Euryarchaeota archaeon]|jgi:uncharacterized OB-fold protein|nr:hypothetical protein [Euryarchaeota archaeon]